MSILHSIICDISLVYEENLALCKYVIENGEVFK